MSKRKDAAEELIAARDLVRKLSESGKPVTQADWNREKEADAAYRKATEQEKGK